MILVISCHTSEFTTELVMDWIEYLGGHCKRLNGIDILDTTNICIDINSESQLKMSIGDGFECFDVAWFRRWMDGPLPSLPNSKTGTYLAENVSDFKRSEYSGITGAMFLALEERNWLDLPPSTRPHPNKLRQLKTAQLHGLKIPHTILTNNKRDLKKYLSDHSINSIIIKPIREIYPILDKKGDIYSPYTFDITGHIDNFPDFFFPSKFQENIDKQYEVRVFFLNNVCNSMAIFSASDDQTKSDFRNYNWKKPNRAVPHKLPFGLSEKINMVMKSLNLKTGSLDFIVNGKDEYVFLEINPTGQFGMVSFPCNYFLEKEVANTLINNHGHAEHID